MPTRFLSAELHMKKSLMTLGAELFYLISNLSLSLFIVSEQQKLFQDCKNT